MTRAELTDRLMEVCAGSRLSIGEKVTALRVAMTKIQLNVSGERHAPRRIEVSPIAPVNTKVGPVDEK